MYVCIRACMHVGWGGRGGGGERGAGGGQDHVMEASLQALRVSGDGDEAAADADADADD